MTVLYETPARPWAFGPLLGTDIVARHAEALVQRYDLRDALAAGGQERRDFDPGSRPDDRLVEVMVRQLVPWVDYVPDLVGGGMGAGDARASRDEGWPIPQGVRLEACCYSPWLDGVRAPDGSIDDKRVFTLPDSAEAFARDFMVRAGLVGKLDAKLRDAFRLTPRAVGAVAMDIRGTSRRPTRAFLLLISRHFEAALADEGRLGDSHPALVACGFAGPAIVAFQRLAELERAGSLVREVERHAHAGAVLRPLLEAANDPDFVAAAISDIPGVAWSQPLADLLVTDPAVRTLCDFLAVSTPALASWYNAVVADRGTFHVGFRPAAALGHSLAESDIVTAVAGFVDVRTALLSAFRNAPGKGPGSRKSALDNDTPFKWYGLTGANDNLGSALAADFASARPGGRPVRGMPSKTGDDDVRVALAEIVTHLGRDGRAPGIGPWGGRSNTGKRSLSAVRNGASLSRLCLPVPASPGAGARADETMWRDRYRDLDFWRFMQDPDEPGRLRLGLSVADATRLRSAMAEFKRLIVGCIPQATSALTAQVIADLATGVSALTVNPHFADAILQLATANASFAETAGEMRNMSERRLELRARMKRDGYGGSLGMRHIPGIEGFTKGLLKRKPK